jgi:RNA polymerase-binding transcription factor DksA
MQVDSIIKIGDFSLYTGGLFLIVGFIFSLFAVWKEGRKDGFNVERLFDKYILATLLGLIVSRLLYGYNMRYLFFPLLRHVFSFWEPGLSLRGYILGFIVSSFILAKTANWSVFRILDIYSLGLSFGGSIALLGNIALQKDFTYLISIGFLLIFYGVFSSLRLKKLLSGLVFIFFLIFIVVARVLLGYTDRGDLIFYALLFTIGTLIFIMRARKTMSKKINLPQSVLNKIKETLRKKEKSIDQQEKLLEEEDPYMQEGRTEDNAELIDDAYLEDTFKGIIDAQKNVLSNVKSNVKKALSKITKGDYGICESCGDHIDPARLDAYPEATLCSECARKKEATGA